MTRPGTEITPGAKSDFWSPKVTFPLQKSLFRSKSHFLPQKSLFRSRSHFSRFRPPEKVKFYKHYKGLAAVARAGAKKADFAEFSAKSTFGVKMVPKVTFFDFRVPKATCRAEARRCACSQRFLDVFYGPRELKCDFCAQKSLLRTFSTSAPKSHFLTKKWLLSEKVTFELPGLENGSIFRLFLKGWEPSARMATFDDEKTTSAEDFTQIM